MKWIWKLILKRRYLRYRDLLDEMPCGNRMAEYVSPRVVIAKEAANRAIRKLNAIGDPACKLKELG